MGGYATMKKRLIAVLTVISLLVFSGCSNNSEEVGNSNTQDGKNNGNSQSAAKTFTEKVKSLQNEMKRYSQNSNSLSPKEVNDISISCSKAFKEVLSAKDSIKATERDLLGGEASFYIKFGKENSVGDTKYRFAEFGHTKDAGGAITNLFLQEVGGKKEPLVMEVVKLISTSSAIEKLVNYDLVNSENSYHAVVFSKFNGAEVTLAKLYGFKLENRRLLTCKFDSIGDNKNWELDNSSPNGEQCIRYLSGACDYKFSIENKLTKIEAINNNGTVLSEVKFSIPKN